ncbi:MAG: transglutaminase family protein [Cyanobacteria bacterium J06598_1]
MSLYRITHTTHYRYTQLVTLKPHVLRLCPRSDGAQWLQSFELTVSPQPALGYFLDALGNTCTKVTFDSSIDGWKIVALSDVCTIRDNPFDYISESWATHLPVDYPESVMGSLSPYLGRNREIAIAPSVITFAQSLWQEVSGHVGYFLMQLTQRIPEMCAYQQRLEGDPYLPSTTLEKKSGTCRDYAVLFVAVCRAVGLAARFVSGYQTGDLETTTETTIHDLHAWAEVYIPGGGWRGFDPTLGLAVGSEHIAIAAAPHYKQAAPVTGAIQTAQSIETQLDSDIKIVSISQPELQADLRR